MTHTDARPARKASRLGLYVPWGAAILLAVGWSLAWVWLSGEAGRRIDDGAARLRAHGWQVAWTDRQIGGYPFRLDVDFTGLQVTEPSGWGLTAPQLKTETYVWQPTHWVASAPAGATVLRGKDGPLTIGAQALRASFSGWSDHPPRISVEGDGLTFAAAPGAKPFPLAAAQHAEFHTLAGSDDQGAVFVGFNGATAEPNSLVALIAGGKPVDLKADAILSHAAAFTGHDWPSAVRAWVQAGGGLTLREGSLTVGGAVFSAKTGPLAVAPDGHLSGALEISLPTPAATNAAVNAVPPAQPPATATLVFKDGKTLLDGAPISGAPKLF